MTRRNLYVANVPSNLTGKMLNNVIYRAVMGTNSQQYQVEMESKGSGRLQLEALSTFIQEKLHLPRHISRVYEENEGVDYIDVCMRKTRE